MRGRGGSRSPRGGEGTAPAPPPRSQPGASPARAGIGFIIVIFRRKERKKKTQNNGLPRKKIGLSPRTVLFGIRVLLPQSRALLPGNGAGTGASGGCAAEICSGEVGATRGGSGPTRVSSGVCAGLNPTAWGGLSLPGAGHGWRDAPGPGAGGRGASPAADSCSRGRRPGAGGRTGRGSPGGAGRARPPPPSALPLVPAGCGPRGGGGGGCRCGRGVSASPSG